MATEKSMPGGGNAGLTDQESEDAVFARRIFANSFVVCGYPEDVARTLVLDFEKSASATGSGKAYRLRIEAKGKNIMDGADGDLSSRALVGFMLLMNGSALSLGDSMTLTSDFEGKIVSKAIQLSQMIAFMAPRLLGNRPGGSGPKGSGPAPGP